MFIESLIKVENIENNWAKIKLNKDNEFGFININSIKSIKYAVKDWVNVAEMFINTPYKWGGKTAMGIDCSGLVQISLLAYGRNIPRNTKDQFKMNLEDVQNQQALSRGDLIFWKGHVGIVQTTKKLLHANQYHMKVFSEDLNTAINRIKEKEKLTPIFKKFEENF